MKTHGLFSKYVKAIVLSAFVIGQVAFAQDAAKVSPGMVEVLLENDNVRVLEIHLQPGETLGGHSHPASIVYFLSECRIKTTMVGKEPTIVERKAGEIAWREPLIHLEENVGASEARALVVEMKIRLKVPSATSLPAVSNEALASIAKNKDKIVNDLNNLSAQTYMYRIRPKNMGGGEGSYSGFVLPAELSSNQNARFVSEVISKDEVRIAATSVLGYGAVKVSINEMGILANWEYSGSFNEMSGTPAVGVEGNRDAMINDLNNLAAVYYQYRIRPKTMGGGGGAYTEIELPMRVRSNENGTYQAKVLDNDHVQFRAISVYGYGVIQVDLDEQGRLKSWYYTDKFR